ncbi:hypothetical protein FVEG_14787 [Fusarium verticillioides 7600]|uniref:Uncharacterized protein n=1 Tax=Gibberella moniliformis (strain M3125 / FGSC 7600) TaxID=334819 RepID=W7LQ62_GIBM7|nr:hypothetical protein FVEG_14787 [Fusarium verticillioides 7600]XP_018743812.1 hypothetical protein FVEG_14787 [Fusarium verticillioides 7600]EWG37619.1 hypothetical protein FVEG_14787 [Fusarium verticillioides 7600]EWG37621.1 hypothetical protein FVEG_14787 [Fusarium verticillioides 7600]
MTWPPEFNEIWLSSNMFALVSNIVVRYRSRFSTAEALMHIRNCTTTSQRLAQQAPSSQEIEGPVKRAIFTCAEGGKLTLHGYLGRGKEASCPGYMRH